MTVLLGGAYPLVVTLLSQVAFPKQANGSLVYVNGQLRGSELIAQKFEKPYYFWSRPSAVDYNPLPSGGSNLGPTAQALRDVQKDRETKLAASDPHAGSPPQDLLFASASGLDPHLSVAAIQYQANRVAAARGISIGDVQNLIKSHIERRQLGMLGEEVVNVLALNMALDRIKPVAPTQEPSKQGEAKQQSPSDSSGGK